MAISNPFSSVNRLFFLSANNVYDLEVTVSDAGGLTDLQQIAVTVTDLDENSPPTITSDGAGPTAAVAVPENQTAVTDVDATDDADAEGAGLEYTISGGADQALFRCLEVPLS